MARVSFRLAGLVLVFAVAGCVQDGRDRAHVLSVPKTDAGADAQLADAEPTADANESDASQVADAGFAADAGEPDSGVADDAEVFTDAEVVPDAGFAADAQPVDVGFLPDAQPVDSGAPVDSGVPFDSGVPRDSGVQPDSGVAPDGGAGFPGAPPYSGGTCPNIVNGTNSGFLSGGRQRSFEVQLPQNPYGAPVVFSWHWYQGTPLQAIQWTEMGTLGGTHGLIVVSPSTCCPVGQWANTGNGTNNPDLLFFDDILSCLSQQYQVNLNRIHSTGMSMGGLWTSFLTVHRAQYLASVAIMSGGIYSNQWVPPAWDIPVVLTWGGASDLYGNFSFETSTLFFSQNLRANGHFVAHCNHNMGHNLPPSAQYMALTWPFFLDHQRGTVVSPYATAGLPPNMPSYCSIPP